MSEVNAKVGDRIEWTFSDDHQCKMLRGKKFEAIVEIVDTVNGYYGVYAEYGQDFIRFSDAVIIKDSEV